MPNIRLKAATQGGLALDVSARTASSSHLDAGVSLVVEPQDSEIFLAADPVITEVIYRASARALQHEIFMTYEAIPVINLPAETIVTSDSIGPFVIGFNPSDTPIITDLPAFTIGFNSLADSATITDLPAFELGRVLSDSFSMSDSIGPFTVGFNPSDSINTSDSIGPFTVGFNPSDTPVVTDAAPIFNVGFNPSDSATMSDSIGPFTVGSTLSDSFSVADVLTSTVQYSRQFTDNVSMLDQFASTVVKPIDTNLSTAAVDPDPVVMSDAPAMTFGFNSLSDSASATDLPAFTSGKSFSDSATPTDSPVFTAVRVVADSASVSDTPALSVGLNSLADNFTLSDTPVFSLTYNLTDSMSVSENIVLQPNKSVVDSISASDNTYEIGASFEGDGGLFNSATLIGSSPPFNEEFALQTFST